MMDFKEILEFEDRIVLKEVRNFELPHILNVDNALDGIS